MKVFRNTSVIPALCLVLSGCGSGPGQPAKNSAILAPRDVLDFRTLYAENCAGCHGAEGRGGAAISLADPIYLAIAEDATIRNVVAKGVGGTSMPAFASAAGGLLTDKQIDVLTSGIRTWRHPQPKDDPPPYTTSLSGDITRGQAVYTAYCESCHGPKGTGGAKGSAITNDSVLALMSDQGLRTIVITGREELGAPDWRNNVAGNPMSDQEITDVVAWLVSHRTSSPGRPYSTLNFPQEESNHVE